MYIIKFNTNSNQEFINQPFNRRNNKELQRTIINQSYFIEKLTKEVLEAFGISDISIAVNNLEILEFTSGKVTFTTKFTEDEIKHKFEKILTNMIEEYNQLGLENLLSFNYKYYEIDEEIKGQKAKDIIGEVNFLNQGLNFLDNHFNILTTRDNKKEFNLMTKEVEKDKKHIINIEEILKVSKEVYENNQSRNLNSYTKIGESANEYIFNKMLLFKLDLNNLGVKFNELKDSYIEDYARTSYEFYKIINKNNIDNKLANLQSRTLFAAGDDIFFIVNFSEIVEVINIVEDLLKEVNEHFNKVIPENKDKITCAGGLITSNYSIPIRMYYEEVEEKLSFAKSNKKDNFINYLNTNYSFSEFIALIEEVDKLIKSENNFKNASTAYYKILEQLQNEQTLTPFIIVSNAFVNESIKISEKAKDIIFKYTDKEPKTDENIEQSSEINSDDIRKKLIALIEIALLKSYTVELDNNVNEFSEFKFKFKLVSKKLSEEYYEKTKDNLDWLFKEEGKKQKVGVGFLIELLTILNEDDSKDKKSLILKLLFRKYNEKYLKLTTDDMKKINRCIKAYSTDKNEGKNIIYANIINIKIKNTLIGDEDEEN